LYRFLNYSLISTKKPELAKSWGLFCWGSRFLLFICYLL